MNYRLLKYKLETFNYNKINNKAYISRYYLRLLANYFYYEYGVDSFIKVLRREGKFFKVLESDFPFLIKELEIRFQTDIYNKKDRVKILELDLPPKFCTCGKQIPQNQTYCSVKCSQDNKKNDIGFKKSWHENNFKKLGEKYNILPENVYEFNNIYNQKQNFKLKCEKCGNIFSTNMSRLAERKHNKLCFSCAKKKSGESQTISYSKLFSCSECNKEFYSTDFKYSVNSTCSDECKKIKTKRLGRETALKNLNIFLDEYDFKLLSNIENYNTVKDNIRLECNCGGLIENNIFNLKNNFKRPGRKCYCKYINGISIGELEVREFINHYNLSTNNKYIDGTNIDILCDDFAVEYNGLYWHSTEFKTKYFHINKTDILNQNNIQLFHIFENEWVLKKEIWKSIINSKIQNTTKIFARKCTIKEVDINQAKIFLNKNHMQGYGNSSIKLGLYYEDELVSIMTFGKPRFNNKYEYELIRFASKINTTVIGGASKLLKYFERNYNPKSIISYANRRWSQGNVYEKLGFQFLYNTEPNYFYFKNGSLNLESRNKYQKHKLKNILNNYNNNISEEQNMYNNNFLKIYDCGNKVYEKIY